MSRGIRLTTCFVLIALFSASCSVRRVSPSIATIGYRQTGVASWYGEDFHGRRTSSGEIYDMHGLTAAHRTLPLGTHLLVTNLDNGLQVKVRVNDRGPFVAGRILDLSLGAARALDMVRAGTALVELEVIGKESGPEQVVAREVYTVQVGSFLVEENARQFARELEREYQDVSVTSFETNRGTFYRVRVGLFSSPLEADLFSENLSSREGVEAFVTRRD